MTDTILTELQPILFSKGLDTDNLSVKTNLTNDLKMDSLDMMDLLMEIEDYYDISIPMSKNAEIHTVGDLIAVISEMQTAK